MKSYYEAIEEDPFLSIPVTFHVKLGLQDPEYRTFKKYYQDFHEKPREAEGTESQRP